MKAELKRAADLVAFQRREALARKRPGSVRGGSSPRWTRSLTLSSGSGFWPWRCWASPPRVWQRERRTASDMLPLDETVKKQIH